jgi:hypothetical protein
MNNVVSVSPTYKTKAECEAEAAALRQTKEAAPADLDALLDELDSGFARLDELTDKDRKFPSEIAAIESQREEDEIKYEQLFGKDWEKRLKT